MPCGGKALFMISTEPDFDPTKQYFLLIVDFCKLDIACNLT